MTKQPTYEARHPVAVALAGLAVALRTGADILDVLAEQARSVGVEPWSPDFDDAARLLATTTPARGTPTSPARTSPWPSATRSHTCTRFGANGRGRNRGRNCPGRVFKGRPTRTALLFMRLRWLAV